MSETKSEEVKQKKVKQNIMKEVLIDKVTVNIGAGESGEELEKCIGILKMLTKKSPVKTKCKVKLPTWGIRPGLAIGAKVVLRKQEAIDFLKLTLEAKNFTLDKKCFTNDGNFSYGIHEYLDIPSVKYDPNLGIRGFDVCVNLKKRGYRVKLRKANKSKVGKKHVVSKNEAIDFVTEKLNVIVK